MDLDDLGLFYGRDGAPITFTEWARRRDAERRVAATTLPDGIWISTVWLGIDHNFGDGPPLIFETMVFLNEKNLEELDTARYATLAEAEAGHARLVARWANAEWREVRALSGRDAADDLDP